MKNLDVAPPSCLRCTGVQLVQGPAPSIEIDFFECPVCLRRYARKPGGPLTFRWLHPVSLALYAVIFERDPLPHAERIAQDLFGSRSADQILLIADEIELELRQPTQNVRDILDNLAAEDACRGFLAAVVAQLRKRLGSAHAT